MIPFVVFWGLTRIQKDIFSTQALQAIAEFYSTNNP